MFRLLAPMDSEAPADFVDFVARHLSAARGEAARLVGGEQQADVVCAEALEDVALWWPFLTLARRAGGPERTTRMLGRRLAARAKRWRDDQIYPVHVSVAADPELLPVFAGPAVAQRPDPVRYARRPPVAASVALRKAGVLDSTVRAGTEPLAEAGIAWVHAYVRQRRLKWTWAGGAAAVVAIVTFGAMPPPV